jgi:hypothetical protein
MGLINSLYSALFGSNYTGDNFTYIAKNMATIYYVIKNSDFRKNLSERRILYATAYIDTLRYIRKGTIEEGVLKASVDLANVGYLVLGDYKKYYQDYSRQMKNEIFTKFTMQIEVLIFGVDSNLSNMDIVESVYMKRKEIEEEINKTLTEGENSSMYKKVKRNINSLLSNEETREYLSKTSLINLKTE